MTKKQAEEFWPVNDDKPTTLTLYDTIEVLSRKNPDWINDSYCRCIFIWQSSKFIESHVKEVCEDKLSDYHLFILCKEFRENGTIIGVTLPSSFGFDALEYIFSNSNHKPEYIKFETSPVRDCYFKIDNHIIDMPEMK
jgi:hypothetical protein